MKGVLSAMRRARQLLFGAVVAVWLVFSILLWQSSNEWTMVWQVFLTIFALVAAAVIWAITALVRRSAKRSANPS